MEAAWAVAAVRAAEGSVMARVSPGALMQRAAFGLAMHCVGLLRSRRGRVAGSRVVVLAGGGNNGGDALYAAALLALRGAYVTVVVLDPVRVHGEGLAACRASGSVRVLAAESDAALAATRRADLVLDGIVGIGGVGALRPVAAAHAAAAEEASDAGDGVTVAVDLPSGVDPDTGVVPGPAVRADVTVTFGCLKPGLLVGAGRRHAGEVRIVDIGLGGDLAGGDGPTLVTNDDADVAGVLPIPTATDTKYSRGVLGVLAGSERYPGAAVLAVGAALATGVGMVRFVSVPSVAAAVVGRWPSTVATPVEAGADGSVSEPGAVGRAGRVQAWLVGPGLGTSAGAREALAEVLSSRVPVVLDADALTMLSPYGDEAVRMLSGRSAPTLLTPHDGEFGRLFGTGPLDGGDRIAAVRAAAARSGAVVLLKGDATLVADPGGGPVLVNGTGVAWLASAGSGDVLAGSVAALAATGLPLDCAAAVGSHLHGRAARSVGGGSSADLVPALGSVIRSLRGRAAGRPEGSEVPGP